ncbi:4-hydroxy-tetrahydrodipicolinate reductase [Rhodovibrionaceae bacterium A322]
MKIGVVGCGGRMGRMLISTIAAHPRGAVAGGTELPGSPLIGQDLGTLVGLGSFGVTVQEEAKDLFQSCEVVIDFSTPAATLAHAALAVESGTALVIGTTGMSDEEVASLSKAAEKAPIVYARNMSMGVNLLLSLVEQVAARLNDEYDIEVLEMHHRHKVDAPSGTALALGEAAAKGRGKPLAEISDRGRDGITGARKKGDIGFAVLRGGDVPGDHSVIFAADGERIELGHRASSREVFARGAVTGALWLKGKGPGLYDMRDVLDL